VPAARPQRFKVAALQRQHHAIRSYAVARCAARADSQFVSNAPFYLPIADEVQVFTAAWQCRLPVLLRGPTGCGKTRFVEHMAATLRADKRPEPAAPRLITVSCHEDLTARDLTGQHLLRGDEATWLDGPLTQAVRHGSVCYLDEVVSARKDTLVLVHPLTDHRRILPLDELGQVLHAHADFMLVISYNPGHPGLSPKQLKQSTRQRFVTIDLDYAPAPQEAQVIMREGGVTEDIATGLASLGHKVRSLKGTGLEEGVSTRLLIYAARLIHTGVSPRRACDVTIARSLTDDAESSSAINEMARATFKT
jgi:nitric oxide reductase NorQ protein